MNRNHAARGYNQSPVYGSSIAYSFLVGKDGTVIQNRSLTERTYHTRNDAINQASLSIVATGDFSKEKPSEAQEKALRELVAKLDGIYHFERIMPHHDASATACPGKFLDEALKDVWRNPHVGEQYAVTRYYTPVPGQPKYYRDTYEQDFKVNCSGDCTITADGYKLKPEDAFKVAACPPEMPFGTRLHIEGIGDVTCHDRGGAIKSKRIDVWAGLGTTGLQNIHNTKGGLMFVTVLGQ